MVDEAGHGTGRLPTGQFGRLRIGIPGGREQKRIVAALDSINELSHGEGQVVAKLEQARRSVRNDLLGGRVHGDHAHKTRLGLIAEISSGATPARSFSGFWDGGAIPWVKTGEVDSSFIYRTNECVTALAVSAGLQLYPPETVLMAMYGEGATRGRVAMLSIPATINQACAAIQADKRVVDPRYLYYYLLSSYDSLRKLGHGSQQTNLNSQLIGNFPVVLPGLTEQRYAVSVLSTYEKLLDYEARRRSKLGELKLALMNELLSGKRRLL